jgi:hypothetical protein
MKIVSKYIFMFLIGKMAQNTSENRTPVGKRAFGSTSVEFLRKRTIHSTRSTRAT